MSVRSVAPLTLTLKPSRRLAWVVSACYGLAALASIANPLAGWLRGLLLLTILASAVSARQRLRLTPAVTQLRISETGIWKLWVANGEAFPVTLLASSIVVSWFILLHFRDEGQRFHALALMPDSCESDGFRQLIVRLRLLEKSPLH